MFARIQSLGLLGVEGFRIDVEADLSQGLPGFDVVGLPGAAVRESRDRVRASIKNCGFTYPVSRITVNLAPADVRKEGSVYDLPLLLALLKASGQLHEPLDDAARYVWGRGKGARLRDVAASVMERSRTLGALTVAEGIETPEQLAFLRAVGCELIQGCIYAKPLPVPAFEAWRAARGQNAGADLSRNERIDSGPKQELQ